MSFTPNLQSSQSIGFPNIVVLTDTSTGSDSGITSRRIYCQDAANAYYVPSGTLTNYVVWDYALSSISLNILTQDTALYITVQWLKGTSIGYSLTILSPFDLNARQYLLNLTLAQISSNINTVGLSYNNNFYMSKIKLYVAVNDAANAALMNNIYGSQDALNRGTALITNQNNFF